MFGPACGFILGSLCTKFYVDALFIDTGELNTPPPLRCLGVLLCVSDSWTPCRASLSLSADRLGLTPEDPRWIGAWWAGFLLCGALLFCSALFMFGFPQSLPTGEREEGPESEQVMLPPSATADYETQKASNGVAHNHEPANSPTCCQQLRGEFARAALQGNASLKYTTRILMLYC